MIVTKKKKMAKPKTPPADGALEPLELDTDFDTTAAQKKHDSGYRPGVGHHKLDVRKSYEQSLLHAKTQEHIDHIQAVLSAPTRIVK